jgi:RNA 3'-terminal phosphate cyclase (ATP)
MIEIDGSLYSGSGTLVRYGASLATVTREPLHMTRIRAKRPKPGLRAQHLSALSACAIVSGGRLDNANVGSQEISYYPGNTLVGGSFRFDIGTAGSATMAAFTLIPPALFAAAPSRFTITGGLFQDFAPSFHHVNLVLLRILASMGAKVSLRMIRPGYVPRGQGQLIVEVTPCPVLEPIRLVSQGSVVSIRGVALSSHLEQQHVATRMAKRSTELLRRQGYDPEIEIVEDTTAVQRGAALMLWAETETGCVLGADRVGRQGRRSEDIADFVVSSLTEDLRSGACTDRHLADQLVLFAALAHGTSELTIPRMTEHVETNLWLVKHILGVRSHVRGNLVRIEGTGMKPRSS